MSNERFQTYNKRTKCWVLQEKKKRGILDSSKEKFPGVPVRSEIKQPDGLISDKNKNIDEFDNLSDVEKSEKLDDKKSFWADLWGDE